MRKPFQTTEDAQVFIRSLATDTVMQMGYPTATYHDKDIPSWTWAYPVGLMLSQWLLLRGLDPDLTPPAYIPRAIYQPNFRQWHFLSDDLVYAMHLAFRGDGLDFLAGEVLKRRRSPCFRFWRKAQRVTVWIWQWFFRGSPVIHQS